MKNLTAITASQLKRDAKEDKKKSMLSRLAPEAKNKIFDLFLASDWEGRDPISDKGLLNFFEGEFAVKETQECPGGFMLFTFCPKTAKTPKNKKDRQHQVRAMFGATEVDMDAIKQCAENDFCLPETLCELEEQLCQPFSW
jgi:hypothetical protein